MSIIKGDQLKPNEDLGVGEYLKSANGEYLLQLQDNGRLVLTGTALNRTLWHSGPISSNVGFARFQDDGNFVIYEKGGDEAIWSPRCEDKGGKLLILQDDGNLVVYDAKRTAIWSTGTFLQKANMLSYLHHDAKFEQTIIVNECLFSANGKYSLGVAQNGNLELKDVTTVTVMWSTGTAGEGASELRMQDDGNLVLYKGSRKEPVWATKTNKTEGDKVVLEDWGDLVMYDKSGGIVWSSINTDAASWMKHLRDDLKLSDICIPGSHDAGMYSTKNLFADLAITQSLSLKQQMECGCRYFDLRPRYIEGKGLYVYHGAADGPKLEVIFSDIKEYCESSSFKTEVIILNFAGFADFEDDADHVAFVKLLKEHLGDYLYRPSGTKHVHRDPPLKELRGKIIVSLGRDRSKAAADQEGLPACRLGEQFACYDDYADRLLYERMVKDQKDKFKIFNSDSLFLLNWTLTPPNENLLEKAVSVAGVKVWLVAIPANKLLAEHFAINLDLFKPNDFGKIVNIINHDFVGTADVLPICRYVTGQK